MELDSVRSQIKEEMINKINDVLQGNEKSVKIHYVRPNDIVKYLETIDLLGPYEDIDTNGWSWDMWMEVNVNNVWYMIATDGYYNNFVEFSYHTDRNKEDL